MAFAMNTKTKFQQVLSARDFDLAAPGFKTRKPQEKTRTGCLACKAKKVKCDEARPLCLRCQRNSRFCIYGKPSKDVQQSPTSNTAPLLICDDNALVAPSSPDPSNGTPQAVLQCHLQDNWSAIFPMPCGDTLSHLVGVSPLVRNTLLAIAAGHLRHLRPEMVQHRIAEQFYQSLAIRDCRSLLAMPKEALGQSGVQILMLGAGLLSMLALTPPEWSDAGYQKEPPAFDDLSDDQFGWLALQASLRPVLRAMGEYMPETLNFMARIFLSEDATAASWVFSRVSEGLSGMPERWIMLFDLARRREQDRSPELSTDYNVFSAPAIILSHLRHIKPIGSNVFQVLTFLSKMHLEFRTLLNQRDARALWLLGYGLGLLCRFDEEACWWCAGRTQRDYSAIKIELESRGLTELLGGEGQLWGFMLEELSAAPMAIRHQP